MAERYPFLSPAWVEAARAIYASHAEKSGPSAVPLRMNLVIEGTPFSDGPFAAHLDSTGGVAKVDTGHLEHADLAVSLGYPLAKAVLVDGNAQAGIEGFMTGQVRVEGDVTRLLAFQQASPSEDQLEIASELRSITE